MVDRVVAPGAFPFPFPASGEEKTEEGPVDGVCPVRVLCPILGLGFDHVAGRTTSCGR